MEEAFTGSGPALTLLRVTISGNGVTGSGGGLQATAGALNITDSTLSGNTCSNQIGPCPGGGGLAPEQRHRPDRRKHHLTELQATEAQTSR